MPERMRINKDRAYTHEEIDKLLEILDERLSVVILLLSITISKFKSKCRDKRDVTGS